MQKKLPGEASLWAKFAAIFEDFIHMLFVLTGVSLICHTGPAPGLDQRLHYSCFEGLNVDGKGKTQQQQHVLTYPLPLVP